MNSGSGTGSVAALSGMAVDERGRGGGLGLGELEAAAADLLAVLRLEDLYHPLDGGRGRAGGGLGGSGEGVGLDGGGGVLGLGLRNGAVALGEGAGRHERLHEAAHDGVVRVLRRQPDGERREQRLRGLRGGGRRGGVGGSLGGRGLGAHRLRCRGCPPACCECPSE